MALVEPRMKLTAKAVLDLPIVEKETVFFDDALPGFGVRVMPPSTKSPRGSRSWVVCYRPGGGGRRAPKKRVTLGAVGVLDAPEARSMAKDLLADVRRGEDPAEQRAEARRAATVAELWPRYEKEVVALRKPKTRVLYETYWRLPCPGSGS